MDTLFRINSYRRASFAFPINLIRPWRKALGHSGECHVRSRHSLFNAQSRRSSYSYVVLRETAIANLLRPKEDLLFPPLLVNKERICTFVSASSAEIIIKMPIKDVSACLPPYNELNWCTCVRMWQCIRKSRRSERAHVESRENVRLVAPSVRVFDGSLHARKIMLPHPVWRRQACMALVGISASSAVEYKRRVKNSFQFQTALSYLKYLILRTNVYSSGIYFTSKSKVEKQFDIIKEQLSASSGSLSRNLCER